jgi:soluble lytic murein transglycosylase-like protein
MQVTENLIYLKVLVLNPKIPNEIARKIASAVHMHARRYKQEVDLILAIMSVESAFDPQVVSKAGAIGLMQVMPQWIDILGIQCDLTEPDCNTRYGLQILGAYQHLYADLDMALTAYNRGPGPVDAALMRGKSPDNGYSDKIRSVYERLRDMNTPVTKSKS